MPEHEEFRLNYRGPSRKAKYYRETDSAQYREGKVKRTLSKGVKKNLKPCAYKRSERARSRDGVPFA